MLLVLFLSLPLVLGLFVVQRLVVARFFNVLSRLPGPPVSKWFANHLEHVLNPSVTPRVNELFVQRYGRVVRIRGFFPWDERLLVLDPVSVMHIMRDTSTYEKPWEARTLITSVLGCGLFSAEGQMHRRMRRVAMPAFSSENMSSLVEITFRKGLELRDTWATLVAENAHSSTKIDVCHFLSRAAFDVIGLAGFDYSFNSINDETNELFLAYRKTFEVFISQTGPIRTLLSIYLPWVNKLFADETVRVVEQSHKVVRRVAGRLIQEKKQKIADGEKYGDPYDGKDLLTLLLKSNAAKDLPLEQRISDEDILNNINTFIFAGSDTSSMSMTWTLLLLARHPRIQDRLRAELLSVSSQFPVSLSELSPEQMQSLYVAISALPFLHNVTRESLRLIPPLHSTLRVPTRTDEVPTSHPIPTRSGGDGDKYSFTIPKGTVVHVSFEAFNVDKSIWGDDAWDFKPDRWDTLPNAVYQHPWHFSNMFSFSAGPRACPGLRFSLIEIKIFYYILLTNFVFQEADKITPYNVVLTRPYISGRFRDGAQCPLLVSPFVRPS